MAKKRSFEMAAAYVSIMPSLEGIQQELTNQISSAIPGAERVISSGLGEAFREAGSGAGIGLAKNLMTGVETVGDSIFSTLGGALSKAGGLFSSTLTTGAKAAMGTIGAGVTAVLGQTVKGGFSRAMGLNEARAKLDALGYTGEQLEGIMDSVDKAITGTSATMGEAMGTTTQLLSAGITDYDKLEQTLANVSKLSDISGTSFADMGTIFAKNAASGKVQYQDLVQLMNHQIPIMSELSKAMGKPVDEIRSMASAGEITFDDFQDAIENIDFDSAVYAAQSAQVAFSNVMANLSRIGEKFWNPIIDGAAPVFNNIRQMIRDLINNPVYEQISDKLVGKIERQMKDIGKRFEGFVDTTGDEKKFSQVLLVWKKNIEDFMKSIEGLEGVIAGVGVAMASGFLSHIPIIGGLFGGITLGVGALGGAFIQAYRESERFQKAISGMFTSIKNSMKGLDFSNILGVDVLGNELAAIAEAITDLFDTIEIDISGFSLNPLIEFISRQIYTVIDTIAEHAPEVEAVIKGLSDTFGKIFETLSDQDGAKIKGLTENLIEALGAIQPLLETVMQVSGAFLNAIVTVASSDFAKSLIGHIVEFLDWLADSQIGKMVGVAMAGIYGITKIMGPLSGITKFFPALLKGFGVAPAVGKAVGGGLKGMITAISSAGTAALPALKGIGVLSALVLAIGGVIWLLNQMGTFDTLHEIGLNIVELFSEMINSVIDGIESLVPIISNAVEEIGLAVGVAWDSVSPIFEFIQDSVMEFFETFSTSIETIVLSLASLVDSIADAIMGPLDFIIELLKTLSETGVSAGAGALAAAGGITALAGALVALTAGGLIQSLGDFAAGAVDSLGELFGFSGNSLTGLIEAAEILSDFNDKVLGMPDLWESVAVSAYSSGETIMTSFGDGLIAGLAAAESRVTSQVQSMMSRIQSTVSSTPVNLRVNAAGVGTGTASYTTNNNYSIRTSNNSVARSLITAARGARRY